MLAPGGAQQSAFTTLLARLNETAVQLHQVYKADVESARLEIAQLRGIIAHESEAGDYEPDRRGGLSTTHDSGHSRFELFFVSEDGIALDTHNRPMTIEEHAGSTNSHPSLDEEANGEVASEIFNSTSSRVLSVAEYPLRQSQSTTTQDTCVTTFALEGPTRQSTSSTIEDPFSRLDLTIQESRDIQQSREGGTRVMQNSKRVFFSMRSPWVDQPIAGSPRLTALIEAETRASGAEDVSEFFRGKSEPADVSGLWFILHPESRLRGLWILACVGFLLYDIAMVPPEVFFGLEETPFSLVVDTAALAFWTADIALSFLTGVQLIQHVEMRLKRIACIYIKSWFVFDIVIVVPEWVGKLLEDGGSVSSQASVFRIFRYGRFVRLLRMARILKFKKLWPMIRRLAYMFNLSKTYVRLTQAWVAQSCLLLVFVHVISCFWYGVGDSLYDGWVRANGLKSASAGRAYVVSLQWTLSRLHGISSGRIMESPVEMLLDAFLIFLSLAIMAYYFGTVSAVATRKTQQITRNLRKMAALYTKRHKISRALNFKVMKALESSSRYGGAGEKASEEQILLDALPKHLRNDLLFETRVPCFLVLPFFDGLNSYSPRILYQVCTLGLTGRLLSDGEVAFAYDDICQDMLFVVSGRAEYITKATTADAEHLWWKAETELNLSLFYRKSTTLSSALGRSVKRVQHRTTVSEAVLWTRWTHAGSLVSIKECTALSLATQFLGTVISEHRLSFSHACLYAKHFVWCLNYTADVDDLTIFPELSIENLDSDIFHGKEHDHFAFISHYKVEAGTEATLMRSDWENILTHDFPSHPANDLRSPIFIDSEDLTDLGGLKEHVIHTNTLVLLLTPGVLSRPWCLVEIVTAMQHNVNIVPVEIQRPGPGYIYPTEKFYEDLQNGRRLPPGGLDLLQKESITLDDVEKAIRHVCSKIALPFSPHKSKAVREAELQDIFKRCDKDWRSSYFTKHRRRM